MAQPNPNSIDSIECLILFLVAALVTIMLVPAAKAIAVHFDAIDYPNARRVNTKPTPRMGGVAMLGGLVAAVAVAVVGTRLFGWNDLFASHPSLDVNYAGVAVSVLFMFAVGAVDDVVGLNPKVKLAGQVVAACIAVASGLLLSSIRSPFGPGVWYFGWAAYPLTVLYLVSFANVINLIDGLDGLAAGITAISAFTIFMLSVSTGRPDAAIMAISLVGVCVGFLKSNFHPASIFMGDSGSLMLGYTLGVVSLFAVARASAFVSLLVPLLAAGVPILDTASAIVRRIRAHQPIDAPDKGHIHHRLLESGFSQRKTVLIMWAWTAALSVCGMALSLLDDPLRLVVVVVAAAVTAWGVFKLHLLSPVLIHHYHPRGRRDDYAPSDASADAAAGQGASSAEPAEPAEPADSAARPDASQGR